MDLPVFRKGLELVSAQLNKLSQGIRAAQITSVIGGSFTRTPGGTTLIINQQPTGGGGGGGAQYCSFKVADYTQPGDAGLIISVQQDKINGRYPLGMDGEGGTFTKAIPEEWTSGGITWVGVYIILQVNELGQIHSDPEAIRVHLSNRPLDSFGANQAFLIAEITISRNEENHPYISFISNACPLITVQNNGFCPFEISDTFPETSTAVSIQIQNGKIEARTPYGMPAQGIYTLEIPNDGDWHAVYCVLAVDSFGNILPGDSSISFDLYNEWKSSSATTQYVLIGEVTTSYDGFGTRYVSFVQNYCLVPSPIRSNKSCRFKLTDASVGTDFKVSISNGSVNVGTGDRFPDGMGPFESTLELSVPNSGFIYLVAEWDTNDYTVKSGTGHLFFEYRNNAMENTEHMQYNLVGTVTIDVDSITQIYSVCFPDTLTPCTLLVNQTLNP
jgi:hypothetical protein